jgi:hypothetical protein
MDNMDFRRFNWLRRLTDNRQQSSVKFYLYQNNRLPDIKTKYNLAAVRCKNVKNVFTFTAMWFVNCKTAIILSALLLAEALAFAGERMRPETPRLYKTEFKQTFEDVSLMALAVLPELNEQENGNKQGMGPVTVLTEFTKDNSFLSFAESTNRLSLVVLNEATSVYLWVHNLRL